MKKLLLFALLLVSSCNRDIENARIFGRVIDKNTQKPLPGIRLVLEAAYYKGGDNDSYNGYVRKTVTTDNDGYFEVSFARAAFVEIKASNSIGQITSISSEIFVKNKELNLKI